VEVIRIVAAVTAPVESAVPAAVTQSPTARFEDAAAWVSLKVVDDANFTLNVVVLSLGRVVVVVDVLLLELFFEVVVVVDLGAFVAAAVEMPEMVNVVELTAVTLPLPTAILPSRPAKLRAPLAPPAEPVAPDRPVPPGVRKPAPPGMVPVPPWPGPTKPVDDRAPPVQLPPSDWLTATDRAVMMPFEDVPVTVTHSPVEIAEAVTAIVCENVVDDVQLTVV
jgi:hypothetical protein